MAFTRGKKATKAAPARASYAKRKAKEEEIEEQEEIIEEEPQEDYAEEQEQEEQEQAPRTRTGSTSYGNRSTRGNNGGGFSRGNSHGNSGNGGDRKALRLTGLFAGKREGLYSGRLRDEDASNLMTLIEEAQSKGQQISFFLWENQGNPQFSLTANIAAQKQFGGGGRGGFRRGGFNR